MDHSRHPTGVATPRTPHAGHIPSGLGSLLIADHALQRCRERIQGIDDWHDDQIHRRLTAAVHAGNDHGASMGTDRLRAIEFRVHPHAETVPLIVVLRPTVHGHRVVTVLTEEQAMANQQMCFGRVLLNRNGSAHPMRPGIAHALAAIAAERRGERIDPSARRIPAAPVAAAPPPAFPWPPAAAFGQDARSPEAIAIGLEILRRAPLFIRKPELKRYRAKHQIGSDVSNHDLSHMILTCAKNGTVIAARHQDICIQGSLDGHPCLFRIIPTAGPYPACVWTEGQAHLDGSQSGRS